MIEVTKAEPGCIYETQGQRIEAPTYESEELMALARLSPVRRAVLEGDMDTPYKCFGGASYILQKAGVRVDDVRINGVSVSGD